MSSVSTLDLGCYDFGSSLAITCNHEATNLYVVAVAVALLGFVVLLVVVSRQPCWVG